jgi:hypothetical protein
VTQSWGGIGAQHIPQGGFQAREVILDCIPENQLIHGFVDMDDSVACTHDEAEVGNEIKNAGIGILRSVESFSNDFELAFHG